MDLCSQRVQSERQAQQFKQFKSIVKDLNKDGIDQATRTKLTNRLFPLTTETHLLAEIMDIQDELKTIHEVLLKQRDAVGQFSQLLPNIPRKGRADNESETTATAKTSQHRSPSIQDRNHLDPPNPQAETNPVDSVGESGAERSVQRSRQILKARIQARENVELVSSNIATIEEMIQHAAKVQVEVCSCKVTFRQTAANLFSKSTRFSAIGRSRPTRGKQGSPARARNTRSVRAM
jgi:hypothetical protein